MAKGKELDLEQVIANLVKSDLRYTAEAYYFVYEALQYGQTALGLGGSAPERQEPAAPAKPPGKGKAAARVERHLTGQQLCVAIRQFAWQQFGFLAKTVFNRWGVRATGDFGEIVYNLIGVKCMGKSPEDRRADFDNVYDFDEGLVGAYVIAPPKP
jgi:uncharacterized repeat protein (TIGR04138 family)